jgi:hypothetical protein
MYVRSTISSIISIQVINEFELLVDFFSLLFQSGSFMVDSILKGRSQ